MAGFLLELSKVFSELPTELFSPTPEIGLQPPPQAPGRKSAGANATLTEAPHLRTTKNTMTSVSKLQQLRELSVVVADTGDFDAVKRLRPVDCTTNPTLVRKALDLPVYAEAIDKELAWARTQSGDKQAVVEEVVDRLTIAVGSALAAWCRAAFPPKSTPTWPTTPKPR